MIKFFHKKAFLMKKRFRAPTIMIIINHKQIIIIIISIKKTSTCLNENRMHLIFMFLIKSLKNFQRMKKRKNKNNRQRKIKIIKTIIIVKPIIRIKRKSNCKQIIIYHEKFDTKLSI